MKKFKNIYINGCSFTRGHTLPVEETWPELLGNKLKLQKIDQSINGQSFDSIFTNTISHLSNLDPNDTLVVIGTTWATRYSIPFGDINVNITPGDLWNQEGGKTDFSDKLSFHRMVSPYNIITAHVDARSKYFIGGVGNDATQLKIGFDAVCASFTNYYKTLIKYDGSYERNQNLYLVTKLLALQAFLENNNFNYRIVDFVVPKLNPKPFIMDNIYSGDNFIHFGRKWKDKYGNGHPTKDACIDISAVLYDSFNR